MNFRKVNNLMGWITFAIATLVYFMTMEPTVSYWDCGEFLSCAYKIEVGHSPGAPLFMMIQRMFGLLAGGNLQKVAIMINAWSALASSLTILFLFWTITHFAKRLINTSSEEPTSQQTMLIVGAGLVGALAYTFSDTFWFSAVEAEVYATSSFFTALVIWAILKWEHAANTRHADRWLVFIAYMIGLSVGVHLLCLLTIPALAMVYYFKRYEVTSVGTLIALVIGCMLLALVQFGILQGIPVLASKFDLFFVNSMGMPFDSGAVVFMLLLIAILIWAVIFARKRNYYLLHTGLLCIIFVLIGFSSYLAPLIRSRADVPIDMTNPDNAISLTSYLKREQFGQQPLLYGPDFDARPIDYSYKGYYYARSKKDGKDYYETVGQKIDYVFAPEDKRFFPRIHDFNDPNHIRFYRSYLGLGENESPTSADNMSFFLRYHIDWMWWRYFMWNYSGRQNDFEGQGEPKNGNWITGIKWLDKAMGRGDIDVLPNGYSQNPARNQYYLLPFILGILGIIFQFNRNRRDGIITFMLFFFTGIAIAIYLNMPPVQPRERDYAYVSTYPFAIWIGLGVLFIHNLLRNTLKGTSGIMASILLCLVAVPVLMAKENWDDHDRSKKNLALNTARNVLNSCAPNAILFTYGDNDTYPVWYAQEIEGIRPDVRIINTSLLGIDWYIDQLSHAINDAAPVPMIWKREHFLGDRRNYVTHYASPQVDQNRYFNLVDICKFIISDDPQTKLSTRNGGADNYIPTKNMFVPSISMEQIVKAGMLKDADTANYDNDIKFTLPKDHATKDDLAMMNIIAANAMNGWTRPIYFSSGLPGDNYMGLADYMRLEGTVYRLMPFKYRYPSPISRQYTGTTDVDKSYDLFMNTYDWGNAKRNDVYHDEKNRIMFMIYRINSARLAAYLTDRGEKDKAVAVLDKVLNGISEYAYYYDVTCYYMAVEYYRAGAIEKGRNLAKKLVRNSAANINYILTVDEDLREGMLDDRNQDFTVINSLKETASAAGDTATAKEFEQTMNGLASKFGR